MLDPADSADPVGSGLILVYGVHPDVNRCTWDNKCDDSSLTCQMSGELAGHCTDGSGKQPVPTAATAAGQSIHVVVNKLLKGSTLESFACACQGAGKNGCPAGQEWSVSPTDCSSCPDAQATTIDESKQCLDVNADGVPDVASLNPGIATITCAGVTSWGTNGTYTTARGEGYYWPSGNQYATAVLGWQGIGPFIAIEPADALPTNSDCSISISSTVTDKAGTPLSGPAGGATFHTESLAVLETAPDCGKACGGKTDATDVEVDLAEVDITFNVPLDEDSVTATGAVTIVDAANKPVPDTEVSLDGETIIITMATGSELAASTKYTVTVKGTVKDAYGIPFGEDFSFSFTTAAP